MNSEHHQIRTADDLYEGMPFRHQGHNVLYCVDNVDKRRGCLIAYAYVSQTEWYRTAFPLQLAIEAFRLGILYFPDDLEVAKAPVIMIKPKFCLRSRYLNAKYYLGGTIRAMLQTRNGTLVTCDRCRNIANAVIEIGPYKVPICKRHFRELFPDQYGFPVIAKLDEFQPPKPTL